jgi:hypothetical protein
MVNLWLPLAVRFIKDKLFFLNIKPNGSTPATQIKLPGAAIIIPISGKG